MLGGSVPSLPTSSTTGSAPGPESLGLNPPSQVVILSSSFSVFESGLQRVEDTVVYVPYSMGILSTKSIVSENWCCIRFRTLRIFRDNKKNGHFPKNFERPYLTK